MSFLSHILRGRGSSSSFWLETEFSDYSIRLLIVSRGFIPSPCWWLPSSVVRPDLTYESLIHTLYVLFITITLLIHKQTKITCPKSNSVLPVQCLLHTIPVTISLVSVTLTSLLDLLKPRTLKSSLALPFLFATYLRLLKCYQCSFLVISIIWILQETLLLSWSKKPECFCLLLSRVLFSLSSTPEIDILYQIMLTLSWEPVGVPTHSVKADILRQVYTALMIWLPMIPVSSFLVIFPSAQATLDQGIISRVWFPGPYNHTDQSSISYLPRFRFLCSGCCLDITSFIPSLTKWWIPLAWLSSYLPSVHDFL